MEEEGCLELQWCQTGTFHSQEKEDKSGALEVNTYFFFAVCNILLQEEIVAKFYTTIILNYESGSFFLRIFGNCFWP